MMTKDAGKRGKKTLTIQSQPLCIRRSWTAPAPGVFYPSRTGKWVSVSGRFFSLPWGMAHPEGPIRRWRTETDREKRERETLFSLATINNLDDATSRVFRVRLCMRSSVTWLQLLVYSCWVNIYRYVLCAAPSSSITNCRSGECTIFETFFFVCDVEMCE